MPQTVANQDHKVMKDVTVLSLVPQSDAGTAGTTADFLGVIETVDIELKRIYADTTGSHDDGETGRAVRWGLGSVRLTGFSASTSSKFAAIFAASAHCSFLFTESASGDSYQLLCRTETFSKSLGKDANKDTLTMPTEGTPYFGPAGGTVAAMTL